MVMRRRYFAWDTAGRGLVRYDPDKGIYEGDVDNVALEGEYLIKTAQVRFCVGQFSSSTRALCRRYSPDVVEEICWIPRRAAGGSRADHLALASGFLLRVEWSRAAHERHPDCARHLDPVRAHGQFRCAGRQRAVRLGASQRHHRRGSAIGAALAPALGFAERPLGPARWNNITTRELYRAILEQQPYPVRGLLGFGANLLLAHADVRMGREALAALEFYAHADLFMNPTAEMADVVLPVASPFEREALKIGFDISAEAQSLVQLRQPVVPPCGEARSDTQIVFDLAVPAGSWENRFGRGDIEAAYRYQLAPSGITLEQLRAAPSGVHVPLNDPLRKACRGRCRWNAAGVRYAVSQN